MEERDVLIQLKVQNSEAVNNINKLDKEIGKLKSTNDDLKKSTKDLEKELSNSKKLYGENSKEVETLQKKIENNNKSIIENNSLIQEGNRQKKQAGMELKANIAAQNENTGSLRQMQQELRDLNYQYANLTKEQRESKEIGFALQDQIRKKADEYQNLNMQIKNSYVSVGGYDDAIQKAMVGMKGFGNQFATVAVLQKQMANILPALIKGTMSFGVALKTALSVGPLLIVTAIVDGLKFALDLFQKLIPSNRALNKLAKEREELERASAQRSLEWEKSAVERLKLEETINSETASQEQKLEAIAELNRINIENIEAIVAEREKELEIARQTLEIEARKVKFVDIITLGIGRRNRVRKRELELSEGVQKAEEALTQAQTQRFRTERENERRSQQNANELIRAEQQRINLARQHQQLVNETSKRIRDLTLSLLEDGIEKERKLLEAKLEDDLANVKGTEQQKAQLRLLLQQQFQQQVAALESRDDKERIKRINDQLKAELEIRLELEKNNSDTLLSYRLQSLEIEQQEALKRAEELGISQELVRKKFDQRRRELESEFFADSYKRQVAQQQLEFENDMLRLRGNLEEQKRITIEFEQAKLEEIRNLTDEHLEQLGISRLEHTNMILQQEAKLDEARNASIELMQKQTEMTV